MPPSPPRIVQFIPSFYPGYTPPLQPIPRYGLPDLQTQRTSPSPLTQEFVNHRRYASTSSPSPDNSSNSKNGESDEWLSPHVDTYSSNSSLLFVTESELSQSSQGNYRLTTDKSSYSEQLSLAKLGHVKETHQSPEILTAVNGHVASPLLETVTKSSAVLEHGHDVTSLTNFVSNIDSSLANKSSSLKVFSFNGNHAMQSAEIMQHTHEQGKHSVLLKCL